VLSAGAARLARRAAPLRLEWLPPGEAGVKFVPPRDAVFAEPPAEVDDPTIAFVREIQQTLVDILQFDTERIDLREVGIELLDEGFCAAALAGETCFVLHMRSRRLHGMTEIAAQGIDLALSPLHVEQQLLSRASSAFWRSSVKAAWRPPTSL
jgi:hypothetical protein